MKRFETYQRVSKACYRDHTWTGKLRCNGPRRSGRYRRVSHGSHGRIQSACVTFKVLDSLSTIGPSARGQPGSSGPGPHAPGVARSSPVGGARSHTPVCVPGPTAVRGTGTGIRVYPTGGPSFRRSTVARPPAGPVGRGRGASCGALGAMCGDELPFLKRTTVASPRVWGGRGRARGTRVAAPAGTRNYRNSPGTVGPTRPFPSITSFSF